MKIRNYLITGGTGSIGRAVAKQLLGNDITIFSRGEADQVVMKAEFPQFEYIIGDVRDYSEVQKAVCGMDYCFHFAALKHIDICERQPIEAVKTNVKGTLNVVEACEYWDTKLISMSSDKAINPTSVYGRTKALGEAMVNQAEYVNIRSGNVLWSSGSVLPIWKHQIETKNEINITSAEMTRFFVHPEELAKFIISKAGEIGTFMMPMISFRLIEIAEEFVNRFGNSKTKINITGLRAGERLHEYRDEQTSSAHCISHDLKYIFR